MEQKYSQSTEITEVTEVTLRLPLHVTQNGSIRASFEVKLLVKRRPEEGTL